MIEGVVKDPFVPRWTLNKKGMQGDFVEDERITSAATALWLDALDENIQTARYLADMGIHKQQVNRLLEPWMYVTQIITATEGGLNNFFANRCHKDADPTFQKIARMMFLARRKSEPVQLSYGQWHLPFVPMEEQMAFYWRPMSEWFANMQVTVPDLIKHSVARCAWVSYENHDKNGSHDAMLATYDRLVKSVPVHASPIEHQATPADNGYHYHSYAQVESNLKGWIQARKLIQNERITVYDPSEEEIESWRMEEEIESWRMEEEIESWRMEDDR